MKLTRPFAVGLLALCAATAAPAQQTTPQIVQDAIQEAKKECGPDKAILGSGFITERDINGDGRPDYILDYGQFRCGDNMPGYCGTSGCLTQVFASLEDGSYVKVLDENVKSLRFARVNNRPAMILRLHGIMCGRAGVQRCGVTLYWNDFMFHPAN